MSKCVVSWCKEDGLDGGVLPGLCVEHRDETLAKQKDAVATTNEPGYEMRVAGRFELPGSPYGEGTTYSWQEVETISKTDPSRVFTPTREGRYVEIVP